MVPSAHVCVTAGVTHDRSAHHPHSGSPIARRANAIRRVRTSSDSCVALASERQFLLSNSNNVGIVGDMYLSGVPYALQRHAPGVHLRGAHGRPDG